MYIIEIISSIRNIEKWVMSERSTRLVLFFGTNKTESCFFLNTLPLLIYLFVYLFTYLFTYLFIYLFIYCIYLYSILRGWHNWFIVKSSFVLIHPLRILKKKFPITKISLCKYIENFISKNWKLSDKKLRYFSYFCLIEAVLTIIHNLYFEQK